jgi:predicted GNAT family acetyltransferase
MHQSHPEVIHDERAHAFVAVVDGHRSTLDYQLAGEVMTITHTGVPEAVGGRGIAAELTLAAMNAARVAGWRVVPACSYAVTWLKRNPEYADLQATK